MCKYGVNCTRKNLLHFAEYQHPAGLGLHKPATSFSLFGAPAVAASGALNDIVDDDDGDDTDVCESDEEVKSFDGDYDDDD
jgi:hypothetical protein